MLCWFLDKKVYTNITNFDPPLKKFRNRTETRCTYDVSELTYFSTKKFHRTEHLENCFSSRYMRYERRNFSQYFRWIIFSPPLAPIWISFFRNFLHNEMLLNVKIWLIIYVLMRDEIILNNLMDCFWPQSCLKFIHFSVFVLHACFGKIHWLNLRIYSRFFSHQISSHATFLY